MTWKRAAVYVAIWLVLSLYLFFVAGARPSPELADQHPHGTLLNFPAADVVGVELQSGARHVHAVATGGHWQIVGADHLPVPSDLIAAIVAAATEAGELGVADAAHARDFGLDESSRRITFKRRDGSSTTVALGARSPSETGVYARRDDAADIVLIGMDLRYYFDLAIGATDGTDAPARAGAPATGR